ncbi:hypothetical protein [Atlantibacter sp.]|uniref:hypothetical protein n=1 Tax=Atlantibacter sp. TaxID=1903473 RepID=UPI0028AC9F9E|nr:hypothetical protein [Atlantibacter sp.]
MSKNISREGTVFEIDKEYMPYLYLAISAAKDSGFNVEKSYVEFNLRFLDGQRCYEIRFFYKKITEDNWMDGYEYGSDINIIMDIKLKKVLHVYHSK